MWIVCITSVRHVLTVNGYGGRQTKENEKSWCFKGWETLVIYLVNIRLVGRGQHNHVYCISGIPVLDSERQARCSFRLARG